ncbi:cell wall-binding repeat-containing protein [Clostridium lundense]|uniref:cell wall-binding repeat-containing protein n=1 Tax=Clostridium lundense TaxID=319475 RepID=UPI0004854189|nr:cell wall-binding repeat-containing protein [Clostridium lundense]
MKGTKKHISIPLFFILIFVTKIHIVYASQTNIRLGGGNRYETSVKISKDGWIQSDNVVLVSGENFPDAICAAPLAKKYDAPILISTSKRLDPAVMEEIQRLGSKKFFIVGGSGVISLDIEKQLKDIKLEVIRIAGQDRYKTSVKVAETIGVSNGVVLVSGNNFPDALSIASIAGIKQMPILLTTATNLPDSIKEYINSNRINKYYVVGGTSVIYDSVIKGLTNVKRLSGADRYETNIAVIKEFFKDLNFNTVYLGSGEKFPDTLCGSAAAAKNSAPIVLTSGTYCKAQSLIKSNMDSVSSFKILGGTSVISDKLVQAILFGKKTVLGYSTYYYPGDNSSYKSLVDYASLIDEIAIDTYNVDSLGNITGTVPYNQLNYANDNKITTYAMVSNNFNGDTAKTLLENSNNRHRFINNILEVVKVNNHKGVNIDLEGIYYYDRNYFTTFMSELYSILHSQGFLVTVAIPAKTWDNINDAWNGAYDYDKIGRFTDKAILMTYDEHWTGGASGAIASIGWVQKVINYAVGVIPRDKIVLGLAAYGYDWTLNEAEGKAYSINEVYNIVSQNYSQIKWDTTSQSPYFNYTDSLGVYHTLWFENSTSISYKLDIVNDYNLCGVSIWRLGLENLDYWNTIKGKLNK